MAPSKSTSSPPHQAQSFPWLRDLLAIRLLNAWAVSTFFQPDEFFQSLEPAWRLAFGPDSGAWITWEWHHQLRSSIHPTIFAAVYYVADKACALLPPGLSSTVRPTLLIASPSALQALFAALGDWYTWHLGIKIYGREGRYSFFLLFLQLANPFQWFCSTRTFSNSLETVLTAAALYYWPWELLGVAIPVKENPKQAKTAAVTLNLWRLRASLTLAAIAVVLRPTNILIWASIAFVTLTRATLRGPSPLTTAAVVVLVREAILCGSLIVSVTILSDRLYFGLWTFPPYNFLYFNISQSLAVFYGRNPWHYYLLQGLPLLCTTSLPFALQGLFRLPDGLQAAQTNALKALTCTVFVTVTALSFISHKEVRFIYPLLPALNVVAAPFAASYFTTITNSTPKPPSSSATSASSSAVTSASPGGRFVFRHKRYLTAALGVNILLGGFLSILHQPAPLNVLAFLREEYLRDHPEAAHLPIDAPRAVPSSERHGDELFVLFLMPCHSTPWRSHLVYPGLTAYALSCEPPLHTEPNTPERLGYRDEADRFYDDPVHFLRSELFAAGGIRKPQYIVGFEGIEPLLKEFFRTPEGKGMGIKLFSVWDGFNGFFNEDWRRSGRMKVWNTNTLEGEGLDTP